MSDIVNRSKLMLANGKSVYVYGHESTWPKLPAPVKTIENAGHYDRDTNLVHFTEPTSQQDGPTHAEKMAGVKS